MSSTVITSTSHIGETPFIVGAMILDSGSVQRMGKRVREKELPLNRGFVIQHSYYVMTREPLALIFFSSTLI